MKDYYAATLKRIGALVRATAAPARRCHFHLALNTPEASHQRALVEEAKMHEYPPYALMGAEHHQTNIARFEQKDRQRAVLALGAARHQVEPRAAELHTVFYEFTARCRRDVELSFPEVLDGVDANGMLLFHLLTEQMRPVIAAAAPGELLSRYQHALEPPRDASGLVVATLVEQRVAHGTGLAGKAEDLAIVKELRDLVEGIQELRPPFTVQEQLDVEETLSYARKAISLCDVLRVRPLDIGNPAHAQAKIAYESYEPDFQAHIEAEGARHEGAA